VKSTSSSAFGSAVSTAGARDLAPGPGPRAVEGDRGGSCRLRHEPPHPDQVVDCQPKGKGRIGYAGAMATELQRLSDGDLQDVAHFFAHLPRPPR
jgi:hypothetical protein